MRHENETAINAQSNISWVASFDPIGLGATGLGHPILYSRNCSLATAFADDWGWGDYQFATYSLSRV